MIIRLHIVKFTLILISIGVFGFTQLSFYIQSHSSVTDVSIHLDDNSENPPASRTGAPGESDCTSCHLGAVLSSIGVVDFDFDGLDTAQYVPGGIYNIGISVSSGIKNGFQLTILNGNNQNAGSFIDGVNTSTVTAIGRNYIRHDSSLGIQNWQFQWQAPVNDLGNLRAFYVVNKANGNNENTGDKIYLGSDLIYSALAVNVDEIDHNPNHIKCIWDASTKQFRLDYLLVKESRILVNVQSLTGQLIQSTTIGVKAEGQYHQMISGHAIPNGIYIISVFVNNQVFNQKMRLN
ncbi:MAG: choice-of-anchor V domain-containing protein [Crocinitomicaceae bacterium]